MAQTNLKKLTRQLASAYHKAPWSDVEDDASLCVWVRKVGGVELTVEQAGKLRTAMASLIAEDADEQPELFVTMDFDGECWDVWFPCPLGGRQVLESFATKGEAEAFANDQRRSAEG